VRAERRRVFVGELCRRSRRSRKATTTTKRKKKKKKKITMSLRGARLSLGSVLRDIA
jgi:hypothetical protein